MPDNRREIFHLRSLLCLPAFLILAAGCGPRPPSVLLDAPLDYPADFGGRRLFHTPQGYIYARSELDAGEADRWLIEVKDYIKRHFDREMEKGVVVVMDPQDKPIAESLEDQVILERDPAIVVTPPSRPKSVEELRKKMRSEGIPERPMIRGSSVPLTARRLRDMGLDAPECPWAVAAPSHALAVECGVEVGVAAFRKQRPDMSEEQARRLARSVSGSLAKAFEIARGQPVFIVWAQRQSDWSDDQRREAIREHIRNTCSANWLPAPSDEDLQW